MKKIRKILIAVLLFFCVVIKAKAQMPDTTKYLIDSIQPKFSYYKGKPLKMLLGELNVKPVSFEGVFPFWKKYKDTIAFIETCLNFNSINEILKRNDWGIKSPGIYIKFAQPIPIPKAWFMEGGRFEKDDWDLQKERFFRNHIISEIDLLGI